jgi:hypothetical protein
MSRAYAYFEELPIGTLFGSNGNSWRKQSTRTAKYLGPWDAGRVFYFSKKDLVEVGIHSKL